MISIIIRTKNEEKWIRRCLTAVFMQDYPEFEVILVDNESTDATLKEAERFPVKLVEISDREFTFGRALNRGIEASSGRTAAIISGHCVPRSERWLSNLQSAVQDDRVVGAYGRQEPLPETSPEDRRDLWTTFGIEKHVQSKDFFFHNANSLIRRSMWDAVPFDEKIQGVEDREWGRQVISRGYRLAYEPAASVHHYHGIHHGRNLDRSSRVARVIEIIHQRAME